MNTIQYWTWNTHSDTKDLRTKYTVTSLNKTIENITAKINEQDI